MTTHLESQNERFYVVRPEDDSVIAGPHTYEFACELRDCAKRLYDRDYAVRENQADA